MQLSGRFISLISYGCVLLGLALGMTGFVRAGALFIAAGTVGTALKAGNFRHIQFYLALAIAIALFALAIALPRGR